MTDRPILFSGAMIRAILDGKKTQTRRVLKPQPTGRDVRPHGFFGITTMFTFGVTEDGGVNYTKSVIVPFQISDRLWVRETHGWLSAHGWKYLADNPDLDEFRESGCMGRWRPSIHMPRSASRLTLIVTDVRVQRLQDISDADAIAEGCRGYNDIDDGCSPREEFQGLWDSLNAKRGYGWRADPWVAVITFEPHRCNIDKMEARHDRT